jgi:Zn finger protein HypA/HybF involved in hydrogenase expression
MAETKSVKVDPEWAVIRCPACKRKLMTIRTNNQKPPIIKLLAHESQAKHNLETRCPSCRVFVGIITNC